jgi:hypothetical protein
MDAYISSVQDYINKNKNNFSNEEFSVIQQQQKYFLLKKKRIEKSLSQPKKINFMKEYEKNIVSFEKKIKHWKKYVEHSVICTVIKKQKLKCCMACK